MRKLSERINARLAYDAEAGRFTWRTHRFATRRGTVAGSVHANGYRMISIDGKAYRAARLAWLVTHGEWPKNFIDHINGIRDDDRLCNLREATNAENMRNMVRPPLNTSGAKGVAIRRGKFRAYINVGTRRHLGTYATIDEAISARLAAEAKYFGEFAAAPERSGLVPVGADGGGG